MQLTGYEKWHSQGDTPRPVLFVGSAMSDEPAAHAHALLERLFALLHDCRAVIPQFEAAPTDPESVSAQDERLLYYALVGALEAGLVRTAEDADRAAPGEPAALG